MPKGPAIILTTVLFLLNIKSLSAQQYRGAVGARFGYGIGLTGVYIFNEAGGHGLEFLLRYGYHGLILNKPGANIQVLYEKHWEIGRKGSWTAYIGGGPALGAGKKSESATIKYFTLGVSPIVGVDFTSQNLRIPIVLAFDYKPTLFGDFPISKHSKTELSLSYYEIAFSIRIGFK